LLRLAVVQTRNWVSIKSWRRRYRFWWIQRNHWF